MKLFQWYYRPMANEYYFYPFKVKDNTYVYGITFRNRTWIEWFTVSIDSSLIDPNKSYQWLYRTAIKRAFVDGRL